MSTTTLTADAPRPLTAIVGMELRLLGRNWTSALLAAVTPLLTGFLLARAHNDDTVNGVHGVAGAMGMAAVFSVHYHLTAVYATRRQEGVLKRLRAGVLPDRTILLGTALGGFTVFAAQAVLLVAFGVVVLGLPVPAHPWTMAAGLVLGAAVLAALSAALSGLTSSSEAALLTTLPSVSVSLMTPGVLLPIAMVGAVPALIGSLLPLGSMTLLVRAGWLGTTADGTPAGALDTLVTTLPYVVVQAAWLVAAVLAARWLVRWDPRRG
jgi:ABC-2 type transport system permease protein